jgi:VanZ family protein
MTLTYRSVASTLLFIAFTISVVFQLYRASLGTPYAVDEFGPVAAIAYAVLFGVAAAVRSDRRWVWWSVGVVLLANLAYGVAGYYPRVYAARPFDVVDWLEGTLYTGLLLAALGCIVLQLSGTTLRPATRMAATVSSGRP